MGYSNSSGLNVYNFYGRRETGGSVGGSHVKDAVKQLKIRFTGASLNETFLPKLVLPIGAHTLRFILRVDEAFVMTGTSPTVIFGGAAPATNGVVLTSAELAAVGTKTPASTGTGTWATSSATGPTAAEAVSKTLGGTTPAVSATQGKATLIVEYVDAKVA